MARAIYTWKEGAHKSGKAQRVGEQLARLERTAGGRLDPADVVADAANPLSPLHDHFEWDNTEAARQHRLEQARDLIRCVVTILPQAPTTPMRAFVHVFTVPKQSPDAPAARHYTLTKRALADPLLREQVVQLALRELKAVKAKYADLKELAGVFDEIDRLEKSKGA